MWYYATSLVGRNKLTGNLNRLPRIKPKKVIRDARRVWGPLGSCVNLPTLHVILQWASSRRRALRHRSWYATIYSWIVDTFPQAPMTFREYRPSLKWGEEFFQLRSAEWRFALTNRGDGVQLSLPPYILEPTNMHRACGRGDVAVCRYPVRPKALAWLIMVFVLLILYVVGSLFTK